MHVCSKMDMYFDVLCRSLRCPLDSTRTCYIEYKGYRTHSYIL